MRDLDLDLPWILKRKSLGSELPGPGRRVSELELWVLEREGGVLDF